MPDRLELTQNAQFYLSKNDVAESMITEILDAAIGNMEADSLFVVDEFRVERVVEEFGFSYRYSAKVFPSLRPVYFMNENIHDRIFSFIILIEYGKYLAILKKSCANIFDSLQDNFLLISDRKLTSTFNDDDVEFQKISLRNMTISDKALRGRSYEAADLKGLLSTHSAGRSIPYYLKIRQGNSLKTLSTNTGRVVESSQRKSLDEIVCWVKTQIELINNPNPNNKFLDSFAKKVNLCDVLSICEPRALLIEAHSLYDRIEHDGLELRRRNKKGESLTLSSGLKEKLFAELESVYELDSNCKVVGRERCSKLRKNEKTLTITSKILTKFRVVENGNEIPLQKYIVKNGFYSVTFSDPKFMYFMGFCFEDTSGISEIDNILEILHTHEEISGVMSEKGNFTSTITKFDSNSMFGVVESIHRNDDYIFCDDLGIEWADHITFNKEDSCINFIHSKHGKKTTSASRLHDVVGQGIKNLGYMHFTKNQMTDKIHKKFSKLYSNNNCNTRIPRVRKGDVTTIEAYLSNLLADYKLHRKCILSCSFISKASVELEFRKIKSGAPVSGHVIQLLWIISSFAHAVKDMNAIPIIYCCK